MKGFFVFTLSAVLNHRQGISKAIHYLQRLDCLTII